MKNIGEPDCEMGYSRGLIEHIFETEEELAAFFKFMNGQTMGICDGPADTECAGSPHGPVVYALDLERYVGSL